VHPRRLRRLPRHCYTGFARYAVTFCARHRRSVFTDAPLVNLVLTQILRTASSSSFDVVAYCCMPDHLHLLVEATAETASLLEFVKDAKQCSSFHAKVLLGAPLWQVGYFERVLRSDEDTRAVARYILQNPVRAGLVKDACEYRFSGSARYSVRQIVEWVQDPIH